MYFVDRFDRLIKVIEENIYNENITEKINEEFYFSDRVLPQLFEFITNKPIGKYIQLRKLAKSLERLKEDSNLKVEDAAYECGYKDRSSFDRACYMCYGVRASAYRKGLQNAKLECIITFNDILKGMDAGIGLQGFNNNIESINLNNYTDLEMVDAILTCADSYGLDKEMVFKTYDILENKSIPKLEEACKILCMMPTNVELSTEQLYMIANNHLSISECDDLLVSLTDAGLQIDDIDRDYLKIIEYCFSEDNEDGCIKKLTYEAYDNYLRDLVNNELINSGWYSEEYVYKTFNDLIYLFTQEEISTPNERILQLMKFAIEYAWIDISSRNDLEIIFDEINSANKENVDDYVGLLVDQYLRFGDLIKYDEYVHIIRKLHAVKIKNVKQLERFVEEKRGCFDESVRTMLKYIDDAIWEQETVKRYGISIESSLEFAKDLNNARVSEYDAYNIAGEACKQNKLNTMFDKFKIFVILNKKCSENEAEKYLKEANEFDGCEFEESDVSYLKMNLMVCKTMPKNEFAVVPYRIYGDTVSLVNNCCSAYNRNMFFNHIVCFALSDYAKHGTVIRNSYIVKVNEMFDKLVTDELIVSKRPNKLELFTPTPEAFYNSYNEHFQNVSPDMLTREEVDALWWSAAGAGSYEEMLNMTQDDTFA